MGVSVAARGVVAWSRHRLGFTRPSVDAARRSATLVLRPVRARVERDALAPAARRRQLTDDGILGAGHRGDQLAIVSRGRTSGCTSNDQGIRGRGSGEGVAPRRALDSCFLALMKEARCHTDGSSRIRSTRTCGALLSRNLYGETLVGAVGLASASSCAYVWVTRSRYVSTDFPAACLRFGLVRASKTIRLTVLEM